MIRSFVYLAVAWAAVFCGCSVIRRQLQEMDEQDQDQAVARYLHLKGRSWIDKSQHLEDKLAIVVAEIKSRWHKTPEELIRHMYHRRGIYTIRLPHYIQDRVQETGDGGHKRP